VDENTPSFLHIMFPSHLQEFGLSELRIGDSAGFRAGLVGVYRRARKLRRG
jgi:hypothetical protein